MAGKKAEKRMTFIPELKAQLTTNLEGQGVPKDAIERALDRWEKGEAPQTFYDNGCFEVFRTVQRQIEGQQ